MDAHTQVHPDPGFSSELECVSSPLPAHRLKCSVFFCSLAEVLRKCLWEQALRARPSGIGFYSSQTNLSWHVWTDVKNLNLK